MTPKIGRRPGEIGVSPTMAAASAASKHPDPISLAVGEPLELPPDAARQAAERAMREGRTRYGSAAGLSSLRQALAADYARSTSVRVSSENVIITAGGKPALMDAMRCLLDPGDEVLIFAPYWPTFPQQAQWCGAVPRIVPGRPDGKIDVEGAANYLSPRTRMVIINSPSNPTCEIWSREALQTAGDLAKDHDLWILSDEVYRHLAFDGPACGPLQVDESLRARSVVVESFSKRFSMTGYRLGAAIAPSEVIMAMAKLSSAATTHPSMPSQYAGLAALNLDGSWEDSRLASYRQKRDLALTELRGLPGVKVESPDSALYLFPNVQGVLSAAGLQEDTELTSRLRDEAGLLLVPGSAFGSPGHVRFSYGIDKERLQEALARLETWIHERAAA